MVAPVQITGNRPADANGLALLYVGGRATMAVTNTAPTLSGGDAATRALSRSGKLPTGISWNSTTGEFSGTPALDQHGRFEGVIKYEDATSCTYLRYVIGIVPLATAQTYGPGNPVAPPITPVDPTTQLPAQANLAGRWSSSDITPQADNTNLASWTDSIDGAVATASSAAGFKYRINVANGLPAIQCLGTSEMPIAFTGKRFANAIATGTYTAMFIMRGPSTSNADAAPFGAFGGTRAICMAANGSKIGTSTTQNRGHITYATGASEIITLCVNDRINVNGLPVGQWSDTAVNTSGGTMAIGGFGNAYSGAYFTGYLFDVLFWDIQLSAAQVVQAEKWARDRYADAYPWAGATIKVVDGNSLSANYSIIHTESTYANLMAVARGWKPGTWTNTATATRNTQLALSDWAAKIKPALDATGRPLILSYFEWLNGQVQRGEASNLSDVQAYLTAMQMANIPTIFGTSLDFGGASATTPNTTARTNFDNYWDVGGNQSTYGVDGYVPIHTNANIGIVGTNTNATYFQQSDNVHITAAGHVVLQGLFQPAFVTLGG